MGYVILVVVCLLGGMWVFSALAGGSEHAARETQRNPVRVGLVVVVLGVVVFFALVLIGLIAGR
jgi:hypothetical protein